MPTHETPITVESCLAELREIFPTFKYWGRRIELTVEQRDALCSTVKHLRNELRRWQNGDVLPNGWTGLDAGDGFPNLYMYSRSDIVEQARQRLADLQSQPEQLRAKLAQVEQERNRLKEAVSEIAIKKYDEWAFGQCQGLAKRALEKL